MNNINIVNLQCLCGVCNYFLRRQKKDKDCAEIKEWTAKIQQLIKEEINALDDVLGAEDIRMLLLEMQLCISTCTYNEDIIHVGNEFGSWVKRLEQHIYEDEEPEVEKECFRNVDPAKIKPLFIETKIETKNNDNNEEFDSWKVWTDSTVFAHAGYGLLLPKKKINLLNELIFGLKKIIHNKKHNNEYLECGSNNLIDNIDLLQRMEWADYMNLELRFFGSILQAWKNNEGYLGSYVGVEDDDLWYAERLLQEIEKKTKKHFGESAHNGADGKIDAIMRISHACDSFAIAHNKGQTTRARVYAQYITESISQLLDHQITVKNKVAMVEVYCYLQSYLVCNTLSVEVKRLIDLVLKFGVFAYKPETRQQMKVSELIFFLGRAVRNKKIDEEHRPDEIGLCEFLIEDIEALIKEEWTEYILEKLCQTLRVIRQWKTGKNYGLNNASDIGFVERNIREIIERTKDKYAKKELYVI